METQRVRLEELEAIENAVAQRFKRNAALLAEIAGDTDHGVLNTNKKRPLKEIVAQRHEIELMLRQYKRVCCEYVDTRFQDDSMIIDDFESFASLEQGLQVLEQEEVANESQGVQSISKQFKMGTSSTGSVLSLFSRQKLNINEIFGLNEHYGRFVDLERFCKQWNNFKGLKQEYVLSYTQYLQKVGSLAPDDAGIDSHSTEYKEYLSQLRKYLEEFYLKTNVLAGPERTLAKIEEDWIAKSQGSNKGDSLYCAACNKSFAKESVFKGHLSGKKHKKAASAKGNSENANLSSSADSGAKDGFYVKELCKLLAGTITETRSDIERRQALTNEEREEETAQYLQEVEKDVFTDDSADEKGNAGESGEHSDNDENNDEIFNPLNLPLDVDGKPIPYWLWKLQGLDHEYQCEICGNFKYAGRKLFDKHFVEQRHIYGLKCLGIVLNSGSQKSTDVLLSFRGITGIKEATEMWAKMKKELRQKNGDVSNIVEVEDEEGNVMTEAVYEELKKQGLL